MGYLVTHAGWQWWPVFLIPFAIIGALIAWRIWDALPAATRKYIDETEGKRGRAVFAEAEPQSISKPVG